MPKLIVMCGLSGSGKTTIGNQIKSKLKCEMISTDDIRAELGGVNDQKQNPNVFRIFYKRLKKLLREKKTVIADATFLSLKDRRRLMREVNKVKNPFRKEIIVVGRKFEDCLRLNSQRDRVVPEEVIYRQRSKFQIPFKEEGWDDIHIIAKGDIEYGELVASMKGFDQKNPHHKWDLLTHSIFVWNNFEKKGYGKVDGAILHDYGKLFTQTIDDNGIGHYYNHENVGAYEIMTKYDHGTDLDMLFLINYHMSPFGWTTDKAARRWERVFGEEKFKILKDFHECDKGD